jgi:hypothetical protein
MQSSQDQMPASAERHFEILNDGTEIGVHLTKHPNEVMTTINGVEVPAAGIERVKVRKVALRDIQKLSEVLGNEISEIMVMTGKEQAWVESLDDDSFEALIEEGRRLNFSRCSKWLKRRMDLLKAMGQGTVFDRAVETAVQKVSDRLGKSDSQPSASS